MTELRTLLDLTGKVALVTGAGQGVGETTARFLAELGAAVAVNDYVGERAKAVAEAITEAGGTAYPVAADVTDWDGVHAMVEEIGRELGPIDVLVNNAGNAGAVHDALEAPPPFWESTPDDWHRWTSVNFTGVLIVTRAVVGGMVQRRRGRIVTVISEAGRSGEANQVVYSAAKAGAAGFMRGLAKAVARSGVTANCVALGAVRTPAIEPVLQIEELAKKVTRNYPLGRVGEPADAAAAIAFLCSDAASWITAQTYPVNGGLTASL